MSKVLENIKNLIIVEDQEYLDMLKQAGFSNIPSNYPILTEESLFKFLIEDFIEERGIKEKGLNIDNISISKSSNYYSVNYNDPKQNLNPVVWVEILLSNLKVFPPKDVLRTILDAKPHFDNIVVFHKVNEFNEFLVLGKNKNSDFRYYISHWDINSMNESSIKKFSNLDEFRRRIN